MPASVAQRARRNNSSVELEGFLELGGTLAQWYACAAPPPVETEEMRQERVLRRLIKMAPPGLTNDERLDWVALAVEEMAWEN